MASMLLWRRSAAARHVIWTTAFATLLALPALALLLPAWPHWLANGVLRSDASVTFRTMTMAQSASGASAAGNAPAATAPAPRVGGVPFDARGMALFLYGLGVLGAMTKLALDYVSMARLRRTLTASGYDAVEFGIEEPVELLETNAGMPMAAGVLRPAIFLPAESAAWDRERVRMVVLHEYAHVARGDAASQLLARAALCVQWFHPLAWFAWREFLKERERAADDLVLRTGALPSEYAGHLLEIARTHQAAPAGAAAGIAMARQSQLEGRVTAILDSNVKRGTAGRTALAASVLAALVLAAPLATVRAQSQAEQLPPPDVELAIASANAQKNHELLEQAAGAYEKLRKFPEAQKLREAALAMRKLAGNPQYAEGLIRLAELAQKRNAVAEAVELYTQAVQLGDMPETYPALLNLGLNAAFSGRNLEQGREYLQRARNVAKTGNQIARAMTWMAVLQNNDPDRAAETEQLYRTAISLSDGDSGEQALATEMLARFLRLANRGDEAEPLEQNAKTMRRKLAQSMSPSYGTAAVSNVRRVGNGVTAPKLIYKMEPSYSEEARAVKLAGTVLLKVVVDVDGRAKDIQVVNGLGLGLDEKAVEAVSAWRFKPGELDGGALVPVLATIEINFRLL
jgi:TonB family protein